MILLPVKHRHDKSSFNTIDPPRRLLLSFCLILASAINYARPKIIKIDYSSARLSSAFPASAGIHNFMV